MEIWSAGEARVLIPMEHCVITDSFADADGNAVPAACYGFAEGWPLELLPDLTFEDQGEKTKLTLIHSGFPTVLGVADARIGWENRSTSQIPVRTAIPARHGNRSHSNRTAAETTNGPND